MVRGAKLRAAIASTACLFAMLAPAQVAADKLDSWRRIEPAVLPTLGPMPMYSVSAQRRGGVLVDDPRMEPEDALLVPVAVDPDVNNDGFGGGLPLGLVGYLVTSVIVQGRWEAVRDAGREVALATDAGGDWSAEVARLHEAVLAGLADALGAHQPSASRGLESGALVVANPCAQLDPCALVVSQWGVGADARQFELQLRLMLWSPALRAEGEAREEAPDYANLLVVRSDAIEVDRPKSEADRAALELAAQRIHDGLGIPQLVAVANASREADAEQARSRAARLLHDHRQRLRDALAVRWNERSRRLGRAILWGRDDAALMRRALGRAIDFVPVLIRAELSEAAQRIKPDERFPARRRFEAVGSLATVGDHELRVLHGGALLMAPADHRPEGFGQTVLQAPAHAAGAIDAAGAAAIQ